MFPASFYICFAARIQVRDLLGQRRGLEDTCWPQDVAPRSQAGGQPPGVADATGQPAVPAQPHEGSLRALPLPLGPCGWSRLGSSRACFFRGLNPGCRAMLFVAAPWFSNSGGRLSEHFRDRNALGFARRRTSKLVGRAATQLNERELEIIAKPLRLLHESLLSGRSFLALRAETRNYSLPLQPIACRLSIRLGRCSPTFAICHLLRWSLCARALSPLCFRCVRFVDLRWCGSWPFPTGLKAKIIVPHGALRRCCRMQELISF